MWSPLERTTEGFEKHPTEGFSVGNVQKSYFFQDFHSCTAMWEILSVTKYFYSDTQLPPACKIRVKDFLEIAQKSVPSG